MSFNRGLLTSNKDTWETPDELYAYWDRVFGLKLDVCATAENSKADYYFYPPGYQPPPHPEGYPMGMGEDGLTQDWKGLNCWMNPPYGRQVTAWVKKAYEESQRGALVCCLLAARVDTRWWREYVNKADMIRFLPGRVKFKGAKHGATFPSAIVVWLPKC